MDRANTKPLPSREPAAHPRLPGRERELDAYADELIRWLQEPPRAAAGEAPPANPDPATEPSGRSRTRRKSFTSA